MPHPQSHFVSASPGHGKTVPEVGNSLYRFSVTSASPVIASLPCLRPRFMPDFNLMASSVGSSPFKRPPF
ncbi:hypothetical protein NDU88_005144 [Pleurodeles waltl]|uniref:Uncharacterized protein n=1 Tax=Pleurodeles waltl TaxID=8319 RepID=A0AAV7WUD3_PLEWA|nr:hypothetical protein NDU88_005144 [Pleurodeles waltl]